MAVHARVVIGGYVY